MKTTVLLISPHRWRPKCSPHGLEHLAHHLHVAGCDPVIVDFNYGSAPVMEVLDLIKKRRPILVGITLRNFDSGFLPTRPIFFALGVRRLIQTIRKKSNVPIVVGGCAFSAAPSAFMEYLEADYGVAGTDEGALIHLVEHLGGDHRDLGDVPGLLWRKGDKIVENKGAVKPSVLVPIRRDFVDQTLSYRPGLGNHYSWGSIECCRGCNRNCVYCIEPESKGRRLSFKPVEAILEETERLSKVGINWIWFTDSEFNLNLKRSKEICRALIRRWEGRLRWGAYFVPTPFDDELADLMARSGCAAVGMDVGHGDSGMMQRLGKDFTYAEVERTARSLRRAGLTSVKYSALLCGEGETEASIRRGLRRLASLGGIVELSVGLRVYPGTPMEKRIRQMGPFHENPSLFGKVLNNAGMLETLCYVSEHVLGNYIKVVNEETSGNGRFMVAPLVAMDNEIHGDVRGLMPGYSRRRSNDLLMIEKGSVAEHSSAGYV